MKFSNVRFVDIGTSNSGSGSTPLAPLRNLPNYNSFTNDCLYILRKYPEIARTSNTISPTNMTQPENDTWVVNQDSRQDVSHGGYCAFDGVYSSDFGFVTASGENFPHWVSIRNKNNKICVKSYAIRTRYNSSNGSNYNPQTWQLQGSDDGETWTTIDSRNISWPTSDFGRKVFNVFGNTSSYYYHRLYVSSGVSSTILAIGEIEFYDNYYVEDNYYTLPTFGELKSGINKFAFVGCPEPGERFWDVLSQSHKDSLVNAGWINSGNKYATIYCSTVNSINVALSSYGCVFYTENIDYLRNPSSTNFDTAYPGETYSTTTNRSMFFFMGGADVISIRNCRFSAWGVNLDDERYVEPYPSMKCCAYLFSGGDGVVDRLVMENNIINFVPCSKDSDAYCYDGFRFTRGPIGGAYIAKNKFYMTKSDQSTWISSDNNGDNGSVYRRTCIYMNFNGQGNEIWQQSRFVCFNYNTLTIRVNGYHNLNGWFSCGYAEKIEMIGNRIVQGRDMGTYNPKSMNLCLFKKSLVNVFDDTSFCTDYYIKDFYANIPSLWGIYQAYVFKFNALNDISSNQYYYRTGYNRSSKKNIIDNINIILGEGPEVDEISSSDFTRIDRWNYLSNNSSRMDSQNVALYICGHAISSYSSYYYANQANIATNINVSHPWGTALKAKSIYVEANSIRGGINSGDASYVKVKNMSIKWATVYSFILSGERSGYIEVDNLLVEDTSKTNMCYLNLYKNGTIIINKTNYPITSSDSVFSSDTSHYNETIVVQKDIGEEHGFLMKSLNKFVESCNVKHNSNNTLKMFGMYDHERPLRFVETGNSGLSSRTILPGRYKLRINMAFYGDDLYENTVTTPSSDRKNVLKSNNITIGIKTKYGEISTPDVISLDMSNSSSVWSSEQVTPFYQEYYVDIYEPQSVFTTIERFNVYSTGFNTNAATAAIFLDPEIEVFKIGDIDFSNSSSFSTSTSTVTSQGSNSLSTSIQNGTLVGYNISGADAAEFNGRYNIVSGLTVGGNPVYSHTSTALGYETTAYLYYNSGLARWHLDWDSYTNDFYPAYYTTDSDIFGEWEAVSASSPAPSSVVPIYE